MVKEFELYIEKEKLFKKEDKILLAVSGGADSIAMCEIFNRIGLKYAIAHCNFKLRGVESDEDELFVKKKAKELNVTLYFTKFNTSEYAKNEKVSIQMAARTLRYQWLEKIRSDNNFKYIAIAHHQDDVIETLFINLLRGTGISGLHSILPKNNYIIRPILFATKEEIVTFCKTNNILYRNDSSNNSIKYTRNKIRHQIIPIFKEINPSFQETLIKDIEHFKFVEEIYVTHIDKIRNKIIQNINGKLILSINEIKNLEHQEFYLYELLKSYNFNFSTIKDIINSLTKNSGKIFETSTHRLLRNRNELIIETKELSNDFSIIINENTKKIETPFYKLQFLTLFQTEVSDRLKSTKIAALDYNKLHFPLILRKWQKGDWFYPLGMDKKKKISDFLIDQKISLFEKEKTLVLCSGMDIIWVVGHRINNQYKIVKETKKMYIAQVL